MRHLRLFLGLATLMLTTAVYAAVGDTFTIDNLTYKVLTEDADGATGTVSVKAKSTTISGAITIPKTVTDNDITYQVTTLESKAFQNCKKLTSVIVPSTITAIPTYCFSNNTVLESVELPTTIKTLGTYAFSGCSKLTTVELPVTVTTIPTYCFGDCSKLTNFQLPAKVTSIGDCAFYYCTSITEMILPSTLTTIGKDAFYNCSALTTVNLENTKVKTINNNAFSKTALTSITFPTTVTTIGHSAFKECKLVSINGFENTKVKTLGVDVFAKNTGLVTAPHFPSTLTGTGQGTFSNCTSLTTIDLSGSITVVQPGAFYGCTSLQNFIIPANVKTIGTGAFYGCTSLTSITIPATLERCGTHYTLFYSNSIKISGTGATTGVLGYQATSKGAFENCTNLKNINIEEGVTSLGYKCFANTAVEEITIPSTLTHLGYLMSDEEVNAVIKRQTNDYTEDCLGGGALYWSGVSAHTFDMGIFANCKKLKKVTFSANNLTSIGNQTFYQCTNLEDFEIPSTVKSIGAMAFGYTNFEYLTLPDGLEYISDGAFYYCDNLRLIKIPNSVEYMKSQSVYGLNNQTYKDSIYTDIGEVKSRYNTTSVNGSSTGNVFSNNKSQTHVTLPSWLKTSGQVIRGCDKISEITIPAYVIRGGDLVVDSSTPLRSVFFMGDSIPKGFERTGGLDATMPEKKPVTFYVKKSVYETRYPEGYISGSTEQIYEGSNKWVDYNFPVSYKIPVSMTNASGTGLIYKTLCRDFDVDLTHTNDNLPEGVEPLRAYLVEDVDGDLRMVFLNEIKYIPSRLKANLTDADGNRYQGVDEYVGVVLRGTPGYTYYYEIGEHDYTQGAEGQWLMDDAMAYSNATFDGNLMAGDANDDFYVHQTVIDDNDNEVVNYGLNNNRFKIYHKDGWLTYNKAYLQLPKYVSDAIEGDTDAEGNANLTFVFQNADGTTDKVSSIEFNRNCESDIFYNPYGQHVSKNTKGIVINNGKKFVNK